MGSKGHWGFVEWVVWLGSYYIGVEADRYMSVCRQICVYIYIDILYLYIDVHRYIEIYRDKYIFN